MADVKWIKIVTDIFDDTKILLIESMPEADSIIVIWFKLLCLAGQENNSGVFTLNGRIPYTDEMFATIFRRPLNTVRLALKTFEMYGMIEIINDTVTIPNWSKHQTLDQIERNREYMKNYMRKRREEQRLLAEGKTNGKTNSKGNSKANVSGADKIRLDKSREDICGSSYNPFGDPSEAPDSPQKHPLITYAERSLPGFNDGCMTELLHIMQKLPEDVIRHAIDEGCAAGASNWKYVRKVLRNYMDEGITTMEQLKTREQQHQARAHKPKPPADDNPLLQAKFY